MALTTTMTTQTRDDIDIIPIRRFAYGHERDDHHEADNQLKPVDGGIRAWTVLLAAFMFEAILWGLPLSFGVFQEYYSGLPQFSDSPLITYVGSIATGIVYLGAPLMAPLVKRYPVYQRHLVWLGWTICLLALVAGSFADTIGGLIATQGVMYGVGYLIVFYPIVSMVNEWWVARRGFAWGIMLASSGASGLAYPFVDEALLHKYGHKTTLRAMAVATLVLTGPLLPFMKGRLPASQTARLAKTEWSFTKKPLFWLYILSTVTQSLGFYLPTLYLPSYASSIGLSSTIGAVLVATMSVASVLGQLTYGYLSDGRWSLNLLLLSTTIMSSIVSLTLWGLAKSLAPLVIFALVYGFFAYSFLAMRPRMGTAVAPQAGDAMTMFCIYCFAQGIGNVLAGPVSGALLRPTVDDEEYGVSRYKSIVLLTGLTMAVSACFIGVSFFVPTKRGD